MVRARAERVKRGTSQSPGMIIKKLLRTSVNAVPSRARNWIKHIPGVAGLQRYLVNRFLSGAPFVHTINSGPAAGLTFEVLLPLDKAIWAGKRGTGTEPPLRFGSEPVPFCLPGVKSNQRWRPGERCGGASGPPGDSGPGPTAQLWLRPCVNSFSRWEARPSPDSGASRLRPRRTSGASR